MFSVYHRFNDSASDFFSGITGRLTGKVIRHTVYDDGSPDNIINREALVIEYLIGISLIAQKGRQVARMLGMGHMSGVIMVSGLSERFGAVPVFMDMHAVETAGAGSTDIGKAEDLSFNQDSAIRGLIELYRAGKLRS